MKNKIKQEDLELDNGANKLRGAQWAGVELSGQGWGSVGRGGVQ
jgi:hypothetical protein